MSTDQIQTALRYIRNNAGKYCCAPALAQLDSILRTQLFTELFFERLEHKIGIVEQLHRQANGNWNQTFYLLYFRTLGDSSNQENYLTLAQTVTYSQILWERQHPLAVEALLLGGSGLLQLYPEDKYTQALQTEFKKLAQKYGIRPMQPGGWMLDGSRPVNHPVLRLAQAAQFFSQNDFVMDRTMRCKCAKDIRQLFCIEAPEYWRTHYLPGVESSDRPKRIGMFKADIIGINLVTILQLAYSNYTNKDELRANALALFERIPPEHNSYMDHWHAVGQIVPANAFESQALLQLAKNYCNPRRCDQCPVGLQIQALRKDKK